MPVNLKGMDLQLGKQQISKYKKYYPALFFLGGFVFDLLTIGRIDETFQLVQQFLFLLLVGGLLILDFRWSLTEHQVPERWQKLWSFRHEIAHFFLGALLSAYLIFYFKSTSIWSSFLFTGSLFALVLLNEFLPSRLFGYVLRFSLFSLCSCSYFIYLIPILWRHVGFFTFLFSLFLSTVFCVTFLYFASKEQRISTRQLVVNIVVPTVVVPVVFFLAYVFAILPPVPLSVQKMGIYHSVERVGDHYHLFYQRPWWRIWQRGAQDFVATSDDKIVCFVSVFAPSFFKDQLAMEWWLKTTRGWRKTDSIPMQIVGGREKGFRGYSVKKNYDPGDWHVRVVTSDSREVGRIYFSIQKVQTPPADRFYHVDIY